MKCLVTGAAGFIGSHLCERLLALGHTVSGVDAFIPYYPRPLKVGNLHAAQRHQAFRFQDLDLRSDALDALVAEVDVIFHLAAMPGLVRSWHDFEGYWTCNVLSTQRLLDAVRKTNRSLQRFVLASTSSVYGLDAAGDETLPTRPISPYGVTKLAAEHTAHAYAQAFSIPLVTLRYYSVYGPRQRPDMGYFKFIQALLTGEPVTVFGDGQQSRGNTFVADCVDATIRAIKAAPGEIFNVGGGELVNVWDVLGKLEAISGKRFVVRREAPRHGDQQQTFADTHKIRAMLDWQPTTRVDDGLRQQYHWQESLRNPLASFPR